MSKDFQSFSKHRESHVWDSEQMTNSAVDLGCGVYDKATDKMTVHVPISIAAKYI